jgi:cytochrome c-type biogenesis protein CcmF
VLEDGKEVGQMLPAKWYYQKREDEPTTEVGIRRAVGQDLYIVLGGFEVASQSATYKLTVNPLVNWVWLGLGIMVIGSIVSMLPESMFAVAMAKLPAGAATTALLLVLLLPGVVHAQHIDNPNFVPTIPKSELERDLQSEIICMCGTCGRKRIGECTCGLAAQMRDEVAKLVADGKSREQVYEYYIAKYGSQEPLAQPIDEGFNRLAWAVPYMLGATGLLVTGLVAVRWTRRGATARAADASATNRNTPVDPALESRLNDELSNLE